MANSIRDRRCLQLLLHLFLFSGGRYRATHPPAKLYFQMAILIGKSRPRVNIIIWETSAGAAAPKTASAELKKHKGSREEMSPGLGGIRLVFLPGLDGTWEGATDERGVVGGRKGQVAG